MIAINLLPKEMRPKVIKKTEVHFPFLPVMMVLFLIFAVISLYHLFLFSRVGMEQRKLDADWKKIKPMNAEAETLQQEMSSAVVSEVNAYDTYIHPKLSLAYVMNVISDRLPKSVWLTSVQCERRQNQFRLVLNGNSESSFQDSRLVEIQNFASDVKEDIEKVMKTNRAAPREMKAEKTDLNSKTPKGKSPPIPVIKKEPIIKGELLTSSVSTSSKAGAPNQSNITEFTVNIQSEGLK